ncbi:MAG: hypothetical protein LVS60_07450 [Nodosilinea sp. LVE1205-7]|jgi:hypothetical protein
MQLSLWRERLGASGFAALSLSQQAIRKRFSGQSSGVPSTPYLTLTKFLLKQQRSTS